MNPPFLVRELPPLEFPFLSLDLVQPKYDGWFCACEVGDGQAIFRARNGREIKRVKVPMEYPTATLYGELIYGTAWAEKRKDRGDFVAFDYKVTGDAPYCLRLDCLASWLERFPIKGCRMIETMKVGRKSLARLWDKWFRKGGFEGLVFRRGREVESKIWRLKDTITEDYYVTSLRFADRGAKGKAILGLAKAAGGVEVMRCVIPDAEIPLSGPTAGRCVEVEGQYKTAKGAMQSPRFVRWRADKDYYASDSPLGCQPLPSPSTSASSTGS